MSKPSVCPRCSKTLVCNAQDISQCHCYAVALTPKQQADMAVRWQGCLCRACLSELAKQA